MKKFSSIVAFVLISAYSLCLMTYSKEIGNSVVDAVKICGGVIIPALFPFMVVAGVIGNTTLGDATGSFFAPIIRVLYHPPSGSESAIVTSWLGGYPSGARVLGSLQERGVLSPSDCQNAVCYCVNASPVFMISFVGVGIFGSVDIGVKLFFCQILSSIIVARIFSFGKKRAYTGHIATKTTHQPYISAFVGATTSSTIIILHICAFVILTATVFAIIKASGVLDLIVYCFSFFGLPETSTNVVVMSFLEICSGVSHATSLMPLDALYILPFLLSFAGLTVIAQVITCIGTRNIVLGKFVIARILHAVFTQLLAWLWLYDECRTVSAFRATTPLLHYNSSTVLGAVFLLLMCAMLFVLIDKLFCKKTA